MKKLRKNQIIAGLLLGALLLAPLSCEKSSEADPPDLPPVESLLMDFSAFEAAPPGTKSTGNSHGNFLYAYLTVGFWNVSATLVSALPVVAYTQALQQTPEYLGDHTWVWAYDFQLNEKAYTATLTGARLDNETFSMEMVIALASAPEQGSMWFDGVVRYDHTRASWKIYKNGVIPVLEIEWNKDYETLEADLRYTIIETGHVQEGSYIMLSVLPGEIYDASYDVSLSAGQINIMWNRNTLEGRVKSPVHFQDEEWHCWDSSPNDFRDMDCQ